MSNSSQPTSMRFGEYVGESGSSDGYRWRFQNAMLRAVVPCVRAIDVSVSPVRTW